MVLALAWMALSLSACRVATIPAPLDGGEAPPEANPTNTPLPTVAARIPTLLPSATPLLRLETPIIWYLRGTAPQDLPHVNEQLNRELAKRSFQARVEIRVIDPVAFERQMADIQAGGQPWDLVALSASSYSDWREKDRLLPLTTYANPTTSRVENLIDTRLPAMKASLPKSVWDGLLRTGELSAVPNQGAWACPRGVSIRADVASALNLRADLEQAQTYADLTPLLEKIRAALADGSLEKAGVANGDKIRGAAGQADLLRPENAGYDVLWGPLAVRYDDDQAAIVNWYQSDAFLALAGLRRAWQQAGYLPVSTLTPDQVREGYQAGQYVVEVGREVWPGGGLKQAERYGYAWIDKGLTPAFLSTSKVMASLTGVNAAIASQPERVRRVMLLLEWMHTDAELYNLLAYGIEGQHWRWSSREDRSIALLPGSRYQPDFVAQLGNRALSYTMDGQAAGMWAAAGQANAQALASPAMGFRFDPRPAAAESAAVTGILLELEDPIASGQADDIEKAVGKLEKALDEAGLETVQAELEEQYRKWK